MKFNYLRIAVFIILISSLHIQALKPIDEKVVLYTFNDVDGRVSITPGTLVNFSVVIKNLTENTISNITFFTEYARDFQTGTITMIESPVGEFDGTPANVTDVSIYDKMNAKTFQATYLNITLTNFTLNVAELQPNLDISFEYTLNFTSAATYAPEPATVMYYDYWGDLQPVVRSDISPSIEVKTEEDQPITSYLHVIGSENEVDYAIIIYITIGVTILAFFARTIVYFKHPFKL